MERVLMSVQVLPFRESRTEKYENLQPEKSAFAADVATTLVSEYADLVRQLTDPNIPELSAEFAYSRLLGVRGSLCRICPASFTELLSPKTIDRWRSAEKRLSEYFWDLNGDEALHIIARRIEERWTANVEAFLRSMSMRVSTGDLADQIGMLRAIDAIALHLAQRELFRWSGYFNVPSGNTQAVKLRIRLVSLYLCTQRHDFGSSYPAIRSYRETFGISDRHAYPWWFVDCDLTERQMNWTHRRLCGNGLDWRFQ
jgi:hypothetical protein